MERKKKKKKKQIAEIPNGALDLSYEGIQQLLEN